MKVILDSNDVDEAMKMYLVAKHVISNNDQVDIEYTKLRNDGGLTAEVDIIKDEDIIVPPTKEAVENSTEATEQSTTSSELDVDGGNGVDTDGVDDDDTDDVSSLFSKS